MNSDTSQQQHRYRRNGLDRPWGFAQVAAWVVYAVSILQYSLFCVPLLAPCIAAPLLSVFFFLCVFYVFHYASQTILTNPMDVHLQHHLRQQEGHENGTSNGTTAKPLVIRNPLHRPPFPASHQKDRSLHQRLYYRANSRHLHLYQAPSLMDTNVLLPNEPMKQCWICDTSVAEHSMHCKFCNKCVYGFDHHCIWLNTCIGRANYEFFFRTLQSLFAMEVVHAISQLYLILDFFLGGDTQLRIRQIYSGMSVYAPLGIWIAFLAFNVAALLLLGQLYVFHTLLQRRNLTTYEHILQDFKQQRSLARRLGDLEATRVESIARAEGQKDTLRVWRLRCGGFCRQMGCAALDPLKLAPEPEEPDIEAGFANALGGAHVEEDLNHNDTTEDKDDGVTADDDEIVPDADYVSNGEREVTDFSNNYSEQIEASESQQPESQAENTSEYVETNISGDGEVGVVVGDAEYGTYLEHETTGGDLDEDEEDDDDNGTEDEFVDEPDDLSAKSGCSGRSYRSGRSGRSGRSSKSGRSGHFGERDLTSF